MSAPLPTSEYDAAKHVPESRSFIPSNMDTAGTQVNNSQQVAASHIITTPVWLRILQIVMSLVALIIIALCAYLMHGAVLDEEALSLSIVSPVLFCLTLSSPDKSPPDPQLR